LSYHSFRAKDKTFNATMHKDFDQNVGKIKIVPQDFGRVILNLFNNAFYAVNQRATAPLPLRVESYKPTVTVSTRRTTLPRDSTPRRAAVEIRIKDNGTGIPETITAKVFQPFFTTKPTGQGMGLGLSLSYDIITKGHNGTLELITQENEGTEFIITIPV